MGGGVVLGVLPVACPRQGVEGVGDSGVDEGRAEGGSYCDVEGGCRLAMAELPSLNKDISWPAVGVVVAQATGLLLRR